MRITSKGQVTVPLQVRQRLGLFPGTEVRFTARGDVAVMEKITTGGRGKAIVDHMRGRGTARLTTDQIMRLTRRG